VPLPSKYSISLVETRRINLISMSKKCSVTLILEYCVIRMFRQKMHYICNTLCARVRRIHNFFYSLIRNFFFIRFKANISKYGSCSLHIRMSRNIRKHHLLASFASYSLQNICTSSHTNIRFDAKNTCCSKYLLQNEYLLKTFSYWRILWFKIFV
jgi:hypothetical protein